jgi:6-pyruvoyltetrahydropterin/6-carboxytetrahydropterin synthase
MFVFNFRCTNSSGALLSGVFERATDFVGPAVSVAGLLGTSLSQRRPTNFCANSRPFARDDNVGHAVQLLFRLMRARLTKDFTFEAAQTLPNAPKGHKCRGVHGHSFKVELSIEGDVDPNRGWVYDHAKITDAMKPLLKILDHAYLNDIAGLENPTIEKMAEWFWKRLESQCPGLCEIVVHETPTARCVYRGE